MLRNFDEERVSTKKYLRIRDRRRRVTVNRWRRHGREEDGERNGGEYVGESEKMKNESS